MRDQAEALHIGHPEHRHQIGDNQHDILGNLCPCDGAHAAKHGTQQNSQQTEPDAQFKRNLQCPCGDGAGGINLRGHIGERGNHQHDDRKQAGQIAAIARADEIGHRVAAEFAQIRRQQRVNQHIAARPADDESEIAITAEIHTARHGDK